jgi:signal transduction histidine kinase
MSKIEMCEKFESLDHPPRHGAESDLIRLAAVGTMANGIVRDFGNLMQIVRSAVRLIERKLDTSALDDVGPFIHGALQSVDRAAALSRQILGVSRTNNKSEQVVHIGSALVAIKVPILWTAGPSIHVDLAIGDDLPAVFCNVWEFENVVLNLVMNARGAMPNGGRLRVSVVRGDLKDGATVVLCATDTGFGMPPGAARPAFQPAFAPMPARRGSGSGLAKVSEFARRAGGSVRVESLSNRSTSVTLRLPAYSE